jgi:HAD superfamily phosphatase
LETLFAMSASTFAVSASTPPSAVYKAIALFDIDGVVRDVSGSYRRALADTVEHYTQGAYRPTPKAIDQLKGEGLWNNDWEASQEFIYRHFEAQGTPRNALRLNYPDIVAFFQTKYRGAQTEDPAQWDGYICQEPLLMSAAYPQQLGAAEIGWGFFSGATQASAKYVLETRIGLVSPTLVAMEDAPGKPNPTGLFKTLEQMGHEFTEVPVLYIGDTVADMYTVQRALEIQPHRIWRAVGVIPPHIGEGDRQAYGNTLYQAGADVVLHHVEQLTPARIVELTQTSAPSV